MLDFTPATPLDAPLLGELRQRCWDETYRGIYPDGMIDGFDFAWHERRDRARIAAPGYDVYIIRRDSEPIGYLTLREGTPPQLLSLYLVRAHQRQGVGRRAFELARGWCSERGMPFFLCECHPRNHAAMDFYARMGGVIVARETGGEPWQDGVTFRFSVQDGGACAAPCSGA